MQETRSRSTFRKAGIVLALLLAAAVLFAAFGILHFTYTPLSPPPPLSSTAFFASVDTMKVSRDTERHPLSRQEITNIVDLSASLNANYITIDIHWDYPAYIQEWIDAARATGRHVWFRSHPNQWENNNGTTGIMTLAQYKISERAFILAHPSFFRPGDIFDACSEPEEGHYWAATYGSEWTYHAPNTATRQYNAFLRDTSDVADAAFHQLDISGVITTICSTSAYFAAHPNILEQATLSKFGYVTIDSYPEGDTTDPAIAAHARLSELQAIENIRHLPIVIGELGYSNQVNVDDTTQQAVLQAELSALASLPYLAGVNYWVGAGSDTSGGYTHIFSKTHGVWLLRPAAHALAAFYQDRLRGNTASKQSLHTPGTT
ncbi:MAG TPA: hypothetical protein VFN23_10895 [Ktedonobacteraceae bacterium]|nr:hypothetical protein [Ktedonobacteraceae bacterium]